ncbi:MAG: non-homologous end joining protein Ku [Burkholderiales bacterium]
MAAHLIWKGSISFGLVHIPIGLYSAEQNKQLSFTLLDQKDMAPVGYRHINKNTGKEVAWNDIVKGYEYDKDKFVVLGADDFRRANVSATQTIDIVDFVDPAEISPIYFEKPYFLEPLKKSEKSYALLYETLTQTQRIGIANIVIHTRQHLAAVLPRDNVLILNLLRFHDELRDPATISTPVENRQNTSITQKELDLAKQLVEGMTGTWTPEKYHDTYRDDLLALIDEKIAAGRTEDIAEPVPEKTPRSGEVIDLMALLKRSVEETAHTASAPKRSNTHSTSTDKPSKGKKTG